MVVKLLIGSVFQCPSTHAIAHCVAQDLKQNAGFAKSMRLKYGGVEELEKQNLSIGDVGVLHRDRIILALVTKSNSESLPQKPNFIGTISALHEKCKELNIHHVSCPFIGTGRDQLPKEFVLQQLEIFFNKSDITIYIWKLKPGSTHPSRSLLDNSLMLAGDSNFLRVLNLKPGTHQGHVISGGTIYNIQLSLASNLPKRKSHNYGWHK